MPLIRLILTFFLKLPPPTENTNKRSFLLILLTSKYLLNTVSQPSSLVLAVISETLSVAE